MPESALSQAYLDGLVVKQKQHVANAVFKKGKLFAALNKVRADEIPNAHEGNVANLSGYAYRVVYQGNRSAQEVVPGDVLNAPDNALHVEVSDVYGEIDVSYSLSYRQLRQLEMAGQAGLVVPNELKTQADQSVAAAIDTVESALMSGSANYKIKGLSNLIDETGSFGGLLRSAYPVLACYSSNGGGTPRAISETIIRNALAYVRDNKGWNAARALGFGPSAQINAVKALAATSTPTVMIAGGVAPDKQLGVGRVFYENIEFVDIPGATPGTIYVVNADAIFIVYLPDETGSIIHSLPVEQSGDRFIFRNKMFLQLCVAGGGGIGREAFLIEELS